MKRILITGANSYVGISVEKHLKQWQDAYHVDTVDMIGDDWRKQSFSGYDAVFHVAGLVHLAKAKDDPEQAQRYDQVNHLLAVETAKKAKDDGVKQFVFMSSASVYGVSAPVGKVVMITKDTPLNPTDNYGISKQKAEQDLQALADKHFRVCILRPPMIYGKGCKGNYQAMAALAKKLPVFPSVDNQRSMLYVKNLAEFVRLVIENVEEGIFCPQDAQYVNTSEMVNLIAHANGRGILLVPGFTWALKLLSHVTGLVDKAFGSLCYDRTLSEYPQNYCIKDLCEAVMETEEK